MSQTTTTGQALTTRRGDAAHRWRGADIRPLPASDRLAIGADQAGRHRAATHCLVTVDITIARGLIAASGAGLSFTAFAVASVARTAAEHPEVHAYRDWRGRRVTHRHVDLTVPVEVRTRNGRFAAAHVLRDADIRDVEDISAELRAVKEGRLHSDGAGIATRFPPLLRVPGVVRGICTVLDRSVRARQRTGTVAVTTIAGPAAWGGGFGIVPLALMPLQVVIGGIGRHRHISGHLIDWHEMLDLTVTFDRRLVADASAAEFVARLRSVVEKAEVLPQRWPS
ncbi:MAG: hypothetical protein JF597_01200 [Streptomyces sp.]|uniref:hypothetical protein n=1 Tax=Streptomyces sp. TaxID=1931 RepID=UPI002601516C|nr:hypothetical protein [Streptomyces sp.]MBW8792252.1 hypothetical protein [Streptomyces sp.]